MREKSNFKNDIVIHYFNANTHKGVFFWNKSLVKKEVAVRWKIRYDGR